MSPEAKYDAVRDVLRKYGRDVPWSMIIKINFEKSDPTQHAVARELQAIGHKALVDYEPAFEPWEVEHAELLRLYVRTLCGQGFRQHAEALGLPLGTLVMDKREMGKKDIALTYLFDVVISDRLRRILSSEGLTGWDAQPIQHVEPKKDRFGAMWALTATNELLKLAPETELHLEMHESLSKDDPLFGTQGLFQRGPLLYRRPDLTRIEDFSRTRELFGEAPEAHPLVILSQRAWQTLRKHKIRNIEVEPVVILD